MPGLRAACRVRFPALRFGLAVGQDFASQAGQVEGLALVQTCLAACQCEQRVDELVLLGAGCQDPLMGGAQ